MLKEVLQGACCGNTSQPEHAFFFLAIWPIRWFGEEARFWYLENIHPHIDSSKSETQPHARVITCQDPNSGRSVLNYEPHRLREYSIDIIWSSSGDFNWKTYTWSTCRDKLRDDLYLSRPLVIVSTSSRFKGHLKTWVSSILIISFLFPGSILFSRASRLGRQWVILSSSNGEVGSFGPWRPWRSSLSFWTVIWMLETERRNVMMSVRASFTSWSWPPYFFTTPPVSWVIPIALAASQTLSILKKTGAGFRGLNREVKVRGAGSCM